MGTHNSAVIRSTRANDRLEHLKKRENP